MLNESIKTHGDTSAFSPHKFVFMELKSEWLVAHTGGSVVIAFFTVHKVLDGVLFSFFIVV